MPEAESRPLHLHTLDSLIADLVSGRSVLTGDGHTFALPDDRTRSALEWYRLKGATSWSANVTLQLGEELVDAILGEPPVLPALPARPEGAKNRRLRLIRVEAHRFAGLHKFGTPDAAPPTYDHHFKSQLTLFEGRNGSGKTSLLNAIIWALTGEMLRPQREPESAEDFECWVDTGEDGDGTTAHKLSPLTPMPNVDQYRPDSGWIHADTWVELTFVDEDGVELPPIRRSISRTARGKLTELPPDLTSLGVDPIAVRIGTVMPGLLPLIKVGSESELGRAVSQLTGLSALVELVDHVRRAKSKIDKEFVRNKSKELEQSDENYGTAKDDLEKIIQEHPNLKPEVEIPVPSEDKKIEEALVSIAKHFEDAKSSAFESARDILGDRFDPANAQLLSDLERNIGRALERASNTKSLKSAGRLAALRKLSSDQLDAAEQKITEILGEASTLEELAKNPSLAARSRLYARVAAWIEDHPDPERNENDCLVCGGTLNDAIDPVTGKLVKNHIHEAASDAALLSQTLRRWAESAQGELLRNLPETLRIESSTDLPAHPCDLLRKAIVDELFEFEPFKGVLGELQNQTAEAFDDVVSSRAPPGTPKEIQLPSECSELVKTLQRLDCALRFARWRHENDALAKDVIVRVLGRIRDNDEDREKDTLTGKLLELDSIVKSAQPVSDALIQCERLKQQIKKRRAAEKRIREYGIASAALENLSVLAQLADEQVDQLRNTLRVEAAEWRSRIYLGAYPDTAHELVDTGTGRKGELDLVVQSGGVSAPAQHVTNSSALRASLVAFFFAFWVYVLRERGGIAALLLDDLQELLDDENRERLASALGDLVGIGAQPIVTSYDPRFCSRVSRLPVESGIEHFEVHPATRQQPVIRTTPPRPAIERRRSRFEADPNDEECAREFADICRVYFEAKLGDMFDEPAHLTWAIENPDPTLASFIQRLRPLVKTGPQGMFSAHVFRRFVDHPALADGSPVLTLMNKSHHGRRQEIRAADVSVCSADLGELLETVDQMSEECYRWRRRDVPSDEPSVTAPGSITPTSTLNLDVVICPDLAAFTESAPSGGSQEPLEALNSDLLDNTAAYYLRRPNFGFAAPPGSIAIVEATPGPVGDRRLVVARHGESVFARRLVRGVNADTIGLTAEVPDPRTKNPKTQFFDDVEVAIHQVVGIIFSHSVKIEQGQGEAVLIDADDVLSRVEIAFRITDDSAVPLALDGQVVLGGQHINLDEIGNYDDELVALALDDGSTVFKRIGAALTGELSHLRQFESIGGLGSSHILSIGMEHNGFRQVINARIIVGVLYNA